MAKSWRSDAAFLLDAGLLLVAHRLALLVIAGGTHPREEVYESAFLLARAIRDPPTLLAVALLVLPVMIGARRLTWERIDPAGRVRALSLGCAAILAWSALFMPYNAYFGSAYVPDRLLLAACLVAGAWRPALLVPATLLLMLLFGQLSAGVVGGGWHWPDKRLPVDLLALFVALAWVSLFRRPRAGVFLFCALVLAGAHYWSAAVEKLTIGPRPWSWITDNPLSNLLASAYHSSGWLRPVGDAGAARLANALRPFEPLMNLATVVIEGSAILLLAHRRLTRLILAAFILLHAMIALASGILFWQWAAVDAILIALLAQRAGWEGTIPPPFGGVRAAAGVALIGLGPWLFATINFGWFDSRVMNIFTLRATGESGAEYTLDGRFFAPYDIVMTQATFGFLVDGPILGGTYGTMPGHEATMALQEADLADVPLLRERFGVVETDSAAAAQFHRFVERSTRERVRRGRPNRILGVLAPPFHFQRFRTADAYDYEEPLHRIAVIHEERFFDGARVHMTAYDTVAELRLSDVE
ncbi:MAG TPA: hypothetical protein VMT87_02975 [Vicinamibacteria bacterium]|nr:hypothetical protein [Vicinamibacteria bacterium]